MSSTDREGEDMSLKSVLDSVRSNAIQTTVAEAREVVYRLLTGHNNGFFIWTSLDDSSVWWLRVPRPTSVQVKTWLNGDQTHIIHICDPIRYADRSKRGEFRKLIEFSGYARDGACLKCKQVLPDAIKKTAETSLKVINFSAKFDEV
jgi:hypothetical protein